MCIIVDANAAHRLVAGDPAGSLVLKWLLTGGGKMVVSKALLKELVPTPAGKILLGLDRAGKLMRGKETECTKLEEELRHSGNLKSNDAHVVALAKSSCCDLVFTHDKPLHVDLKNKILLGFNCSIYQSKAHRGLLSECIC